MCQNKISPKIIPYAETWWKLWPD